MSDDDTRHVVTARFLFADKADADQAAKLIDQVPLSGLLAAEILIVEA
jgi:hypothetical protein